MITEKKAAYAARLQGQHAYGTLAGQPTGNREASCVSDVTVVWGGRFLSSQHVSGACDGPERCSCAPHPQAELTRMRAATPPDQQACGLPRQAMSVEAAFSFAACLMPLLLLHCSPASQGAWGKPAHGIPVGQPYAMAPSEAQTFDDEEAFEEVEMARAVFPRPRCALSSPRGRGTLAAAAERLPLRPPCQNLLDHGRTHVCDAEMFASAPQPTQQARKPRLSPLSTLRCTGPLTTEHAFAPLQRSPPGAPLISGD